MKKEVVESLIEECGKTKIVAATKYIDSSLMRTIYEYGIRDFGENRTDVIKEKRKMLADLDCKWHFIGHLQRNKAKDVINLIDCLHSLDSLKLAEIIDRERVVPLDCMIEVKLSMKASKSGVLPADLPSFINELKKFKNIHVIGLMTMTDEEMDDEEKTRIFDEVDKLRKIYNLECLSIGMSDDYRLALKKNPTYVRLGRVLFDEEDIIKKKRDFLS